MKSGHHHWSIFILLICFAVSCGAKEDPDTLIVSGTLEGQALIDYPDKPVMVAVMKSGGISSVSAINFDDIQAMVSADKVNRSFEIDLTDSGLSEGDAINLVAFVDKNYSIGLPNPDSGDNVGIYIDQKRYSIAYVLHKGINKGLHIVVNRLIRPFNTQISGTIKGNAAGEALIVAYAGDFETLDFTGLNPDKVIGYKNLYKGPSDQPYTIELLPYSADLQTERVYIIVLLDDTGVGLPAPGNIVGFHTDPSGAMPMYFPVDNREGTYLTGVDIDTRFPDASVELTTEVRIPEPSGDTILLNGHITLPDNFDENQGAVFVMVAGTSDPASIMKSPFSTISYFAKMPKGETDYSLDLSESGLFLEDEVMVIALWDKDHQSGFPDPTPGDVIGYLSNKKELAYSVALSALQDSADIPEGWNFALDKIIYNHHASIEFRIDEDAAIVPRPGEAVIAFALTDMGRSSSDPAADYAIDMDYVVGMHRFIAGQDGPPYRLEILPALYKDIEVGQDPFLLSDIYLFGLLDNDAANGVPDENEYIGYCRNPWWHTPLAMDIQDGVNVAEQPFAFPNARLTYGRMANSN